MELESRSATYLKTTIVPAGCACSGIGAGGGVGSEIN